MAKKTTSVDELYANRHRPYGQVRDGSHRRIEHEPDMRARDKSRNQDVSDKHSPAYSNDCSGWVRGAPTGDTPTGNNETATNKPMRGFDKSGAWRLGRDGINHGQGDPAIIRRPEPNKP